MQDEMFRVQYFSKGGFRNTFKPTNISDEKHIVASAHGQPLKRIVARQNSE